MMKPDLVVLNDGAAIPRLTCPLRIDDSTLTEIVANIERTSAQVRCWHLQHGNFPKLSLPAPTRESFSLIDFSLSDEQVQHIDNMERNGRVSREPNEIN